MPSSSPRVYPDNLHVDAAACRRVGDLKSLSQTQLRLDTCQGVPWAALSWAGEEGWYPGKTLWFSVEYRWATRKTHFHGGERKAVFPCWRHTRHTISCLVLYCKGCTLKYCYIGFVCNMELLSGPLTEKKSAQGSAVCGKKLNLEVSISLIHWVSWENPFPSLGSNAPPAA